jgi:hypothetical protein
LQNFAYFANPVKFRRYNFMQRLQVLKKVFKGLLDAVETLCSGYSLAKDNFCFL